MPNWPSSPHPNAYNSPLSLNTSVWASPHATLLPFEIPFTYKGRKATWPISSLHNFY